MALIFDANGEIVNVGSASSLDDLDPFTVVIVFNPVTLDGTTFNVMWSKSSATNEFFTCDNTAGSGLTAGLRAKVDGYNYWTAASLFSVDTWYVAAFSFDSSASATNAIKFYWAAYGSDIAAEAAVNTTDGTRATNAAANMTWGNYTDGTLPSRCRIARVGIFPSVMTAAVINTFYRGSLAAWRNAGALDLHDFRTAGAVQPDHTGNGNNGAMSGATIFAHPHTARNGAALLWMQLAAASTTSQDLSDSFSFADTLTRDKNADRTLADSFSFSDAGDRGGSEFQREPSDSFSFSDALQAFINGILVSDTTVKKLVRIGKEQVLRMVQFVRGYGKAVETDVDTLTRPPSQVKKYE